VETFLVFMRVGVDGIRHPALGKSIMANAVCINGQKRVCVDSRARWFSLTRTSECEFQVD
jgi:hypothetical protein